MVGVLILQKIAEKISISIVADCIKKKGQVLFGESKTKFTKELETIIYSTIEEFDKKYQIEDEGNKFAFYKSDDLIQLLLNIKFVGRDNFDPIEVKNILAVNTNVIQPKKDEIIKFLDLFEGKCKGNSLLKKHQFNDNYKEAIFSVLEIVDSINNTLNQLIVGMHSSLSIEYKSQLEEIEENINSFKPKTAFERLNTIEKRIIQNSQFTSEIESKILYLKGVCLLESERDIKGAELIITGYLKNKIPLIRPEVALAYLNLNDPNKVSKEFS